MKPLFLTNAARFFRVFPCWQGAWFVRNEVQQAKDEGLLPDDFVAQDNGTWRDVTGAVAIEMGAHLEQLDGVNRNGILHNWD